MADRANERIVRLCVLLQALLRSRRGVTMEALVERVGASRATVYRDLGVLRRAGLSIDTKLVNGEARHRVLGETLADLGVSATVVAAMAVAREGLAALEGTHAFAAIDALLASRKAPPIRIRARDHVGRASPRVVRVIDEAMRKQRRLRILYRGTNDSDPRWREVDPGSLQLQRGELYLWAWALDRSGWRTFKILRIREAEALQVEADEHPGLADVLALPHAVRVWSGAPEEVAIRIAPEVAWLVGEHPIVVDQRVEQLADGSVVVRASVAGLVEAARWVLRWGAHAQVLEPRSLRDSIRDELRRALAAYATAEDREAVSPIVRHPTSSRARRARSAKGRTQP